jgi:hypothetical protein
VIGDLTILDGKKSNSVNTFMKKFDSMMIRDTVNKISKDVPKSFILIIRASQ